MEAIGVASGGDEQLGDIVDPDARPVDELGGGSFQEIADRSVELEGLAEHHEPVDVAIGLIARAPRKALAEATGHHGSTWIDAACAIGAAGAQLLATQPGALTGRPLEGKIGYLHRSARRRVSSHWPGSPPARDPCRWLIRAYLTDVIVETAGREV